ncbi:MAG: hypothetical protein AB8B48_04360 [Pseudomonadales bacterium]
MNLNKIGNAARDVTMKRIKKRDHKLKLDWFEKLKFAAIPLPIKSFVVGYAESLLPTDMRYVEFQKLVKSYYNDLEGAYGTLHASGVTEADILRIVSRDRDSDEASLDLAIDNGGMSRAKRLGIKTKAIENKPTTEALTLQKMAAASCA